VWLSERDDGGEQAGWVSAAGEGAAEFDSVERYVLRVGVVGLAGVGPAAPASQVEGEGLAVAVCPFGNDVGDDPAIVVGAEIEWPVKNPSRVGAVHPQVAQVDRVDEVADCPGLVDRPVGRELDVMADERRGAGAAAHGLGGGHGEPLEDLDGAEAGAVAYLDSRQGGFQRPAVLLAVGTGLPQLADVLADRRAGFGSW
jgi:hypothetical protein